MNTIPQAHSKSLKSLGLAMSSLFAVIAISVLVYFVVYCLCYRYPNSEELSKYLEIDEQSIYTEEADIGLFRIGPEKDSTIYEYVPKWVAPWSGYFSHE